MTIKLKFKPLDDECAQFDECIRLQNTLGIYVADLHKAIYRHGLGEMLRLLRTKNKGKAPAP